LTNYNINQQGMIVGQYSNGQTRNIGQVAVADFSNPQGLDSGLGGMLSQSVNSGPVVLGTAGSGALGSITSGALESSNVDLTTEFTNLITAQRAFEANSKVITTMDTIMGDTNQMIQ
jgi:flagellar hook protein FlgE